MRIPHTRVLKKIRRIHRSILRRGLMSTGEVTLHYKAAAVDYDRNDPDAAIAADAAALDKTKPVRAGIHFISDELVAVRGFRVLAAGDVILDFECAEDLDLPGLRFEINGRSYTRKEGGAADLAGTEGSIVEGEEPYKTVVVSPLPQ